MILNCVVRYSHLGTSHPRHSSTTSDDEEMQSCHNVVEVNITAQTDLR